VAEFVDEDAASEEQQDDERDAGDVKNMHGLMFFHTRENGFSQSRSTNSMMVL
jgi:hypothetical protein